MSNSLPPDRLLDKIPLIESTLEEEEVLGSDIILLMFKITGYHLRTWEIYLILETLGYSRQSITSFISYCLNAGLIHQIYITQNSYYEEMLWGLIIEL